MNLVRRKNRGISSLFSDMFGGSSLVGRDIFDMESDLFPSRLGINVPTANIAETPKEFKVELAAPGLERKDFNGDCENYTSMIHLIGPFCQQALMRLQLNFWSEVAA